MESFKEKAISEQLFCFQISELDSDLLIVHSCDAAKKIWKEPWFWNGALHKNHTPKFSMVSQWGCNTKQQRAAGRKLFLCVEEDDKTYPNATQIK